MKNRPESRVVLVTGGAGFVGSHIVDRLSTNCTVHILDNLSTGSMANIGPEAHFHKADIRSESDLRALFESVEIDAVVHCAAQTSVAVSMTCPDLDWEVNVLGTSRLVRLAEEFGVSRFVFLSSGGAIYGNVDAPAQEDALPAPESHYGLNKFGAEQIIRVSRLSYAILRPSNIYGPRQRADAEGGVVATFRERLLRGDSLELHGTGKQRRDFVYIEDVVSAVELSLQLRENDIWNVGTGVPTSISELAGLMSKLTCSSLEVLARPRRKGDVDSSLLAPARILGTGFWGPPVELQEGLRRLVLVQTRNTGRLNAT